MVYATNPYRTVIAKNICIDEEVEQMFFNEVTDPTGKVCAFNGPKPPEMPCFRHNEHDGLRTI